MFRAENQEYGKTWFCIGSKDRRIFREPRYSESLAPSVKIFGRQQSLWKSVGKKIIFIKALLSPFQKRRTGKYGGIYWRTQNNWLFLW